MLLGELQMAFICFLVGQSLAGLEQWKCIIELLCRSEEAIILACQGDEEFAELYQSFIGNLGVLITSSSVGA